MSSVATPHPTHSHKRAPRERRLQWLDSQMRASTYPNPQQLQEQFDVSERTAFSDIAHLRKTLGATVAHSTQNHGWYYIEPPRFLPLPAVNPDEAAALRRALLLAREYLGDTDHSALQRLSDHIGAHVPDAKPSRHETARGASHLLQPTPAERLFQIHDALVNRQKLRFQYKSPRRNDITERIVAPYHLDNVRGEWYLVARCDLRDGIRTFHTARMQDPQPLPAIGAYSIPTDFDAYAELSRGLLYETGSDTQTIVLEFDAYQSPFIRERLLHPTEVRHELPGGALQITLQIPVTDEVKRWLLGYGRHVVVRKPEHLRHAIREEIAALKTLYELF